MRRFFVYVVLCLLMALLADRVTWDIFVYGHPGLPEVLPPYQYDRIALSAQLQLWREERDTLLGCQEPVAFLRDTGCR